jgi:hypothetical protein
MISRQSTFSATCITRKRRSDGTIKRSCPMLETIIIRDANGIYDRRWTIDEFSSIPARGANRICPIENDQTPYVVSWPRPQPGFWSAQTRLRFPPPRQAAPDQSGVKPPQSKTTTGLADGHAGSFSPAAARADARSTAQTYPLGGPIEAEARWWLAAAPGAKLAGSYV